MDKNESKKFLLSEAAILIPGFLIAYCIFRFTLKDAVGAALPALLATIIPAGTFTGFVTFGLRLIKKEKLSKGIIIAVCVFFPLTLAIITVSGIILIIPAAVKSIITIIRG